VSTLPADQIEAVHRQMVEAIRKVALEEGDPIRAAYLSGLCDAGHYRILSWFDFDDAGEPDPYTLRIVSEVRVAREWKPLSITHWSALGLDEDDVLRAHADAIAQGPLLDHDA
jgi:hypothetical protein